MFLISQSNTTGMKEVSGPTPEYAIKWLPAHEGIAFVVEHLERHPQRRFSAGFVPVDKRHVLDAAAIRIENGIHVLPVGW
jgi:hypothetical protein